MSDESELEKHIRGTHDRCPEYIREYMRTMFVGETLVALLAELMVSGTSRRDLAKLTGIKLKKLDRLLSGRLPLDLPTIADICAATGCTPHITLGKNR